jgi:hypothetical protein
MNIKMIVLALASTALAVSLTACDTATTDDSDGGKSRYYDTCVELNKEPGATYEDPDVCAADAEQLAEDLAQMEESSR